ncbi:fluoride efflux transporter CrcB [Parabacteroides bouchesdurhonensis]|uniref:fluoride efflux transporter CrcB n=1 Tax=Parabacteroides bouchesdurhonensis TaxID=1936995 RepID=UPI000C842057|nr:fluoride efflux transporter CrcB [Parabacteroides bouchesdurhonensis]RHJ90499.1 fluoride efflux transporter CrcB [Bacteroides sp. AM07-16]
MIKVLFLIAGGAIGSAFRYGVSMWVQRTVSYSFPFGILSVNVIGSFLIGFTWSLAEAFNFSTNTRAFLFTGLFGGFTTFSSFALDTATLMKTGEYKLAFINIFASNLLGLIAVFLGLLLGKNTLTLIK